MTSAVTQSEVRQSVTLSRDLKDEARRLGFSLCGICPALTPGGLHRLGKWLDAGYAGEMDYLLDYAHAHEHPHYVLDGARSLVVLGMSYHQPADGASAPGQGRVSRYAQGVDYHNVIHDRLNQLKQWLQSRDPSASVRGVVDSAPLMEREFAELAGLGWIGKHTLLLNRHLGSWFFLAVLLTDRALSYDTDVETDHCGTCTACLDACPTDAFVEPYVLDARKCISYLTIEHRSAVPRELRGGMQDWIFGCDVCQDVCPWNHRAPPSDVPEFQTTQIDGTLDLCQLMRIDDDEFRRRFRHTPLWRAKRRGLLRNAAIALGNQRHQPAVPVLIDAMSREEPIVRGACAWALGQIGGRTASDALSERLSTEADAEVRDEMAAALQRF